MHQRRFHFFSFFFGAFVLHAIHFSGFQASVLFLIISAVFLICC